MIKELGGEEMSFYYKQVQFTVLFVDAFGNDCKTHLRADDETEAEEKADYLANCYDWQKIKEIKRS